MELNILNIDPSLKPYSGDLQLRMENFEKTKKRLLKAGETLKDFANAHMYFGFHQTEEGWYYREWAPGADAMYLTGFAFGITEPGLCKSWKTAFLKYSSRVRMP